MAGIIVAQLLLISVFQFWPQQERNVTEFIYPEDENIFVEEMVITKQANTPASPPKPQVPIPVPNDKVIEDEIEFPEFDNLISFDSLSIAETTGQTGDENRISGNPDRPPRISRIVEPTLSSEALNANLKIMILVNFTVNKNGTVREAYVAEIRKYNGKSDEYEVVQTLGYGIIRDVMEAAYKWRFRPATEDGEEVGAYIQEAFLIGF
ncbi:MAG: hypothetical protein JJ895_07210 [Balneolaceae bacterium]|nr:hypothetical protein [Balneolaceae bacterium]